MHVAVESWNADVGECLMGCKVFISQSFTLESRGMRGCKEKAFSWLKNQKKVQRFEEENNKRSWECFFNDSDNFLKIFYI